MKQLLERLNLEDLLTQLVQFTPRLVTALVILILFWAIYRLSRSPIRSLLSRSNFAETLIHMIVDNIYRVVLMLFAIVMAADQVGINVAAAVAGMGIAGIALGFAAQDSLANTIAGFVILWDKPFQVGEWITVTEQYGQVSEITMRSTRIRTLDNTFIVIPNKSVIDQVLINHTKNGETRVCVPVGIAYKEQIQEAKRVILDVISRLDGLIDSPAPSIVVTGLGASSVDLEVRVWIENAADEKPMYNIVLEAAKLALDEAGIEIPYHHMQLFIENVEDRVWEKAARLPALTALKGGPTRGEAE